MPERPPPAECANCGAQIPRGARACPECGADERTGWRDTSDTIYDGLDLPDDDANETASSRRNREVNGVAWYWWCVGVALVVLLGLGALSLLR